jgi:hypothetical protein
VGDAARYALPPPVALDQVVREGARHALACSGPAESISWKAGAGRSSCWCGRPVRPARQRGPTGP